MGKESDLNSFRFYPLLAPVGHPEAINTQSKSRIRRNVEIVKIRQILYCIDAAHVFFFE